MADADMKPPRRTRLGVALLVTILHVLAVAALVRAFAPSLAADAIRPVVQAFDVIITAPIPEPSPELSPAPVPSPAPEREEGAAAPRGTTAKPQEVVAPTPKVVLARDPAPAVAGTGTQNEAGASDSGPGTGAGGEGQGTGAGAAGSGTGGGGSAAKAVKIAGDIVSARDYPRATRDLRLGSSVTIALTVSPEGRVSDCRVLRPSRDPEADRITCQLATERFRFRPARDAAGRPVPSVYGWQQRWFTPGSR
ncbi:TonB family protein [Novosphingobium sp. M1R2S20]|uniref:TonB family protein n=1 Tax=Novosphingobium rhizovicinum TaxID=3228928 RepID=A0ABV3R8S9_9SPHN